MTKALTDSSRPMNSVIIEQAKRNNIEKDRESCRSRSLAEEPCLEVATSNSSANAQTRGLLPCAVRQ
jgi:hypothetical protein